MKPICFGKVQQIGPNEQENFLKCKSEYNFVVLYWKWHSLHYNVIPYNHIQWFISPPSQISSIIFFNNFGMILKHKTIYSQAQPGDEEPLLVELFDKYCILAVFTLIHLSSSLAELVWGPIFQVDTGKWSAYANFVREILSSTYCLPNVNVSWTESS